MKLLEKLLKPFQKHSRLTSKQDLDLVIELNKKQIRPTITDIHEVLVIDDSKEESSIEDLTELPGIGPKTAKLLYEAGYSTKASVIQANKDDILKVKGISLAVLSRLRKLVS